MYLINLTCVTHSFLSFLHHSQDNIDLTLKPYVIL